jgi:hypothetical protein
VPLITPDEACTHDGPSSAACAARDEAEIARRDLSAKTCTRLFANQEVMQTACISSCRSYTSGDGQDCAFNYSRSLHEVAAEQPGSVAVVWYVILVSALVSGASWAVIRARRKARA